MADDIAGFIRSSFRSVWSLELLLFLKRGAERSWTRAELVAGLRASDVIVAQGLDGLDAAGLVSVGPDGARFHPASADLERLVIGAEELYARSPDAVRRAIVGAGHGGLTAFADAFRLRKD